MSGLNWVEWHGGPMLPDIAPWKEFWTRSRLGEVRRHGCRSDCYWGHIGHPGDIVAYAVAGDSKPAPTMAKKGAKLEEHLAFNRKVNESKPSKVRELKKRVAALEDRVALLEGAQGLVGGIDRGSMGYWKSNTPPEKPADGREWKMSINPAKTSFWDTGAFFKGTRK